MEKNILVQFNNGYTDIINLISIVKYYSTIYLHIILIIRDDVIEFVDFFLKNNDNIDVVYIKYSDQLKYHHSAWADNIDLTFTNSNLINFCTLNNIDIKTYERKYIGHMDRVLSNIPGNPGPENSKFEYYVRTKCGGNWLKAFYLSNNSFVVNFFVITFHFYDPCTVYYIFFF